MTIARLTNFIEACTGVPSTPEQVVRVANLLYSLAGKTDMTVSDDMKASVSCALARNYLRHAVKNAAEAIESKNQEIASLEAIRLAGESAMEDV